MPPTPVCWPQVFNKVDVVRHEFALEWMADFETYSAALEQDASYAATLSRSLSLVLDEFYQGIRHAGVSALTGEGMDEFMQVGTSGRGARPWRQSCCIGRLYSCRVYVLLKSLIKKTCNR